MLFEIKYIVCFGFVLSESVQRCLKFIFVFIRMISTLAFVKFIEGFYEIY